MSIRGAACIAGAYEHPLRNAPDTSLAQLHAEVARGAVADAGLSLADVDGLFCSADAPGVGALTLADHLGLRVRHVDSTDTGGSSPIVHCAKGEGGRFVADGNLVSGVGRLPVNTDGGGLCNNHPAGRGGMTRVVEAVRQLRGEAHPAVQVAGCDLALAHGIGGSLGTRHSGAHPGAHVTVDLASALADPGAGPALAAAADGRLLLRRCRVCRDAHYYPRVPCPFCGGDELEWEQAAGTGRIYSYAITRQSRPPCEPWVIAYVTLTEGPTLMTNIVDTPHEQLAVDLEVQLVTRATPHGIHVPFFRARPG